MAAKENRGKVIPMNRLPERFRRPGDPDQLPEEQTGQRARRVRQDKRRLSQRRIERLRKQFPDFDELMKELDRIEGAIKNGRRP